MAVKPASKTVKTELMESDIFEDNEVRALRPVHDAGEFVESVEPDAFTRIRAFCESGGQGGMLGIYRALPNRREQFITKLDASEFDPELIKGRFGGGDFIIKAYDENSKIRLNQRISIEGEPIIESAKPVAHAAPVDISALLSAIQESNRQLLAGLAQIMQPQPQPTRAEMLAEMAAMRDLFVPAQNVQQTDPMAMFLKGVEMARTIAPREGGASGMDVLLETVRSFAPALNTVVSQNVQVAQSTNKPAVKPPVPCLEVSGQSIQNKMEDKNIMLMKYYLGLLVNYAKQNRDVALYADLIADNLNIDQISELLSKPDPVAYLASIEPGVMEVRPWFEQVIAELRGLVDFTEPDTFDSVIKDDKSKPAKNESETGNNATS